MLNDLSLSNYDTRYKLSPPLRSDEDRKFVEQSLKNGIIDAISSDHSPQNRDSKLLPFAQAKPGSLGLETLFSTTLSLVNSGKLPIEKAIHLITYGPAKVLNLNLGTISKGRPADFTVIDPDKSWIVKGESMNSLSSNTCFEKMPMQGVILSCWKNGRKIF
jgi:dihydroorotase